jgi:hypothetical protein
MNLKKAILAGVLIWILIFVEWSLIIFTPILKDLGFGQWIVHYVVLIPIVLIGAKLYYKNNPKINGYVLGLVFLAVGIILDLIITVPLFMQGGYVEYYSNNYLWLGFLEMILITGLYSLKKN